MSLSRLSWFPLLLLALATSVSAQDDQGALAVPGVFGQGLDQAVYKRLVGNVLDAVPMHPLSRLDLQRTNAVVSNILFGRSLAVLAGLSNPVLLLGGFVWGMWAASNIKPAEAGIKLAADPVQSGVSAATAESIVALLDRSFAVDNAPPSTVSGRVLVSSISAVDAEGVAIPPPRVIKIWLPQRSAM